MPIAPSINSGQALSIAEGCAQSPRFKVLLEQVEVQVKLNLSLSLPDLPQARLACEIFLSSLQTEFFRNHLGRKSWQK